MEINIKIIFKKLLFLGIALIVACSNSVYTMERLSSEEPDKCWLCDVKLNGQYERFPCIHNLCIGCYNSQKNRDKCYVCDDFGPCVENRELCLKEEDTEEEAEEKNNIKEIIKLRNKYEHVEDDMNMDFGDVKKYSFTKAFDYVPGIEVKIMRQNLESIRKNLEVFAYIYFRLNAVAYSDGLSKIRISSTWYGGMGTSEDEYIYAKKCQNVFKNMNETINGDVLQKSFRKDRMMLEPLTIKGTKENGENKLLYREFRMNLMGTETRGKALKKILELRDKLNKLRPKL